MHPLNLSQNPFPQSEVLSQQTVGVFVCTALPRAVRLAQEDVDKLRCEYLLLV